MNNVVGFDVGTGNLVAAKQISADKIEIKNMRNIFLEINPKMLASTEISGTNLDYAESKDETGAVEKIYILGEDVIIRSLNAYPYYYIFSNCTKRYGKRINVRCYKIKLL